MNWISINKAHRYVGIVVAPFLAIQTISGLLLGIGLFRRPGSTLTERGLPLVFEGWEGLFAKTHFGPGATDDIYHLLLGAGIIWMAVSGWVLYLRGWRARRKNREASGVAS